MVCAFKQLLVISNLVSMIPVLLREEVVELQKLGYQIQLIEVGTRVYIQFDDFPLPENGYTISSTTLLVWTGINYPSCAFDMFWVQPELLLMGNRVPTAAAHLENHLGKPWRRFSIHPYQQKPWNPAEDSLEGFLSYIHKRLNHLG